MVDSELASWIPKTSFCENRVFTVGKEPCGTITTFSRCPPNEMTGLLLQVTLEGEWQ